LEGFNYHFYDGWIGVLMQEKAPNIGGASKISRV